MSLSTIQSAYYGDIQRWFLGVVVNIQDPLRAGRIKVRIYGIHNGDVNEVPERSLPWAQVVTPTTEDGVSGLGRSLGIKPGAQVFGIFMDGIQSQVPLVLGSTPRFESGERTNNGFENDSTVRTESNRDIKDTISTIALVGESNAEKAFNFLISHSFSPIQAAAIIGNFIHESGMDPKRISEVPGEESYGIARWNPAAGRKQELEQFADERFLDIEDLGTQLAFFIHDFTKNRYLGYAKFKTLTNIKVATEYFCDKYERHDAARADKPARIDNAKRVLENYNGN